MCSGDCICVGVCVHVGVIVSIGVCMCVCQGVELCVSVGDPGPVSAHTQVCVDRGSTLVTVQEGWPSVGASWGQLCPAAGGSG